MTLYEKVIEDSLKLLDDSNKIKRLALNECKSEWNLEQEQKIIFQKDMAYELGGGELPALSGLCFTSGEDVSDEIILYGEDLPQIDCNMPYSRITILNVDDSEWMDNQQAYNAMQKIDYTRYHVYPEGFMIRISTSAGREPVRVSKKALQNGIDFAKVGKLFIEAYHRHKAVRGVKIIFITDRDFPYDKLAENINKMEIITRSLDKIFNKLVMDCQICNLKPVCDEVEGMRELHKRSSEL